MGKKCLIWGVGIKNHSGSLKVPGWVGVRKSESPKVTVASNFLVPTAPPLYIAIRGRAEIWGIHFAH